jgi:hypothetical protein
MQNTLLLDKQFTPDLGYPLGKIGVRVVVFPKRKDKTPSLDSDVPLDLQAEEDFSTSDSEVNGYLEFPKRGKMCCVFLVNGQRHHGLDNTFIVNDLKMKYLRKRMIIAVDLDALSQRAIAEIMQGSRAGLYEGQVYQKIRDRLVATLQGDPDLAELEEEAEDELSQLQAGDAVVQSALDELIEHHFDFGDHETGGADTGGGKQGQFYGPDGKPVDVNVVVFGENGTPVTGPVLVSDHAASTLRVAPNSKAEFTVTALPKGDWSKLKDIGAFLEPVTAGLTATLTRDESDATVEVEFIESADFQPDEYPIETTLRIMATFNDEAEPRLIEKNVVVRPKKPRPPRPPRVLNDVPTYLRIATRQPVRLLAGGPDVHVRIVWDGKDSLAFEPAPEWAFHATCKSHPQFPAITFTKPTNGRFEALVHTPADCLVGTKLEFEVQALGPAGATLSAGFTAEVVLPPGPRKVTTEIPARGQRRPPYQLKYITEKEFDNSSTRWGVETWNATHAGAFTDPTAGTPLTLCINQDFGLLRTYMDGLVGKKADEQRMEEKKTKYTSHIAYHLYQMYLHKDEVQKKKDSSPEFADLTAPHEEDMQLEINRVASTLIRLMEVMR